MKLILCVHVIGSLLRHPCTYINLCLLLLVLIYRLYVHVLIDLDIHILIYMSIYILSGKKKVNNGGSRWWGIV